MAEIEKLNIEDVYRKIDKAIDNFEVPGKDFTIRRWISLSAEADATAKREVGLYNDCLDAAVLHAVADKDRFTGTEERLAKAINALIGAMGIEPEDAVGTEFARRLKSDIERAVPSINR